MYDIVDIKNRVLSFVKRNGPVLPVQISREIQENSILAGAVLSELIRNKQIMVSKAKIGGSPVYYVSEQKPKLEMLYKHLGQKHREIFDLLKKERVMKDTLMEPWQRVAVREIEDFSVKLTLASSGEVFWKWYAVANAEAENLINEKFPKRQVEEEKALEELKLPKISETLLDLVTSKKTDEPKLEIKKEEAVSPKKNVRKKKVILPEEKPELSTELKFIEEWLAGNGGELIEGEVLRKKKDIEAVASIKSSMGNVHLFVKFKDKKKISDADLSLAQGKARAKNISLLFLSTGELTKKAEKYAEKNHILHRQVNI